MVKKYIHVLITDNKETVKYLGYNNFVKYLIVINGDLNDLDFPEFKHSSTASTDKFNVYYNTTTYEAKFINKQFVPNSNPELMAKDNKVNILIPTYNREDYTIRCLELLNRQTTKLYQYNIFLMDDCSDEESLKNLIKFCGDKKHLLNLDVTLLKNKEHLGYIKNINKGIKYLLEKYPSTYMVLLHNDVVITENTLERLMGGIKDDFIAAVPLISTKMPMGENNITKVRQRKLLKNLPDSFQFDRLATISDKLYDLYGNMEIDARPDFLKLEYACIAFNTLIFRKIGYFDEIFGEGCESDTDFTRRIYEVGYKVNFLPSVLIKHIGAITFPLVCDGLRKFMTRHSAREIQYSLLTAGNRDKTAIYTCNIDGDGQPPHYDSYNHDKFDYYYFTVNPKVAADEHWKTIDLTVLKSLMVTDSISNEAALNWLKLHPHLLFRNYGTSLYIQHGLSVVNDLTDVLNGISLDNDFIFIPYNPTITSVRDLGEAYKIRDVLKAEQIDKLIMFMRDNNFTDNLGVCKSVLIYRKHNDINCIKLMRLWWSMLQKYCNICDLSYTFCVWGLKMGFNTISDTQDILFEKYLN